MKNDRMPGVFAGFVAIALAAVAYGQQSTPPPATDYAPAAPGATASSPTTETAAPAAGPTSGAAAVEADARANEQTAETASAEPAPAASSGALPPSVALPPPTARPAPPIPAQPRDSGSEGYGGGSAQVSGQRAELGVWLVESGGPGVQVRRITEGSAADVAGLRPGDVILAINGRGIDSPHSVAQMIRQMPAGQSATVQIWRDGQTSDMEIVLQAAREPYEVNFRGDESLRGINRSSGDLESRVMRLEQQLATVLQELRQLRQMQPGSAGSATATGGAGYGETTTGAAGAATTTGTTTETTTSTTNGAAIAEPGAAQPSTPPADNLFDSTTEPAVPPPADTPTTEPAAPATEPAGEDSSDLFGGSTEEPAATEPATGTTEAAPEEGKADADAAPADGKAEGEAATDSDDLFE